MTLLLLQMSDAIGGSRDGELSREAPARGHRSVRVADRGARPRRPLLARVVKGSLPALHEPRSVLSLDHTPSWLMLAAAAGSVNAIGFVACSRFVTHVTGAVSRVGIDASDASRGELAVDTLLVLGCLVLGAVVASALIDGRHHRGKQPLHALPLAAVAILLALLGVAGGAGVFGAFGGSVGGVRDVAFLSLLAFAMGLQNAAVAASTGLIVRTTHMTGAATDLGAHIATALHARGEARSLALRHASLRFGKIAAFTAGAAGGAALAGSLGFPALLVPAAAVFVATLRSFVRAPAARPVTAA